MDGGKAIIEPIADRLKDELDVGQRRLPAKIVEKLFAIEAAEMQRNRWVVSPDFVTQSPSRSSRSATE
jgi:hypothetical protein